jgi:exonuclease III
MRTRSFTFGGANIKGTPPMPAPSVRNDVRKISKVVDVFLVQEFRHAWYWATIRTLLGALWASYPAFVVGLANPVFGGQAIFWKRKLWKKMNQKVIEAFDFTLDNSGIMENRWIRAVLLADKKTLIDCWFVSAHFVVHGDDAGEGDRREHFMHQNLARLERMLIMLTHSDSPIIFEGDLNLHPGGWAWNDFMALVKKYDGRIIGTNGVEFMVVFDKHCATKVVVEKNYVLTPKAAGLKTDHEVRVMDFHLQR